MPPKVELDRPTLLLAGLDLALDQSEAFAWSHATDTHTILAKLRTSRIDLLLLGLTVGDSPFAPVVQKVKAAHAQQRWALVGPDIDADNEIRARSLGVLAIFDGPPSAAQLREMLRRVRPRGEPVVVTPLRVPRPRPPGRGAPPES